MRIAILATAISSALVGLALADPAAAAIKSPTNIAPQELSSALRVLATDRHLQILYTTQTVADRQTSGAVGEFTVDEALTRLLGGTGLVFRYVDENTITIMSRDDGASTPPPKRSSSGGEGAAREEKKSFWSRLRLTQADTSPVAPGERRDVVQQIPRVVEVEEIIVTGSRIQRSADESTTPIVTFERQEIERTGATSLQQLFNYLPQASMNQDASGKVVFAGATTLQLRGLPSGTTLVLINGRRAVVSGANFTANIFNLNNIPLNAVERVEVLTDSASAVYGADALAGVVNVILRKGVTDSDLAYRYGSVADGDSTSHRLSFTTGLDTGALRVTAFAEGFKQSPLRGYELDRVANADYRRFGGPDRRGVLGNYAAPGTVYARPGTGNLPGLSSTFAAIPAGQPGTGLTPQSFAATAGTVNRSEGFAGLEAGTFAYDVERYSGLARADYEFSPALRFFGEVLFNRSREVDLNNGRLGRSSTGAVPASNPFNPFGTAVQVDLALPELTTTRQFTSEYLRVLAGTGGALGSWDWELGLLHSRDHTDEFDTGLFDPVRLAAALADPNPATAINPFVGTTVPLSRLTQALRTSLLNLESVASQADLQFRGALGQLPAGPIQWAVGGEARKEELEYGSPTGDLVPFGSDRTVRSAFVEMQVPLLSDAPFARRMLFTGAVRYDRYSDFGSATSPQFGFNWEMTPWLSLRATRGEAFRPPSLQQLFEMQLFDFSVVDPRRGNQSYIIPGVSGGNPDLEPESGRSRNIALVVKPLGDDTLVASVDFWKLDLSERILRLSATQVLQFESLFPQLVTREAPGATDPPGFAGRLTSIRSVFANFGEAEVEGVDVRVSMRSGLFGGALVNTLSATYVSKYDAAIVPGAPLTSRAGAAASDGYAPRVKASWLGSWSHDGFEIAPGLRYVHSYDDYPDFLRVAPARTVESQTLFDLSAGYAWPRTAGPILAGAKLTLNLVNVLDEDPPYSNTPYGYDNMQYDVLGRQIYLNLQKRF